MVRPSKKNQWSRQITVHDPTRSDIVDLGAAIGDALVMAIEIAVDLRPKRSLDATSARATLENTFSAVAARFRPEDQALWDHSTRGAVKKSGGPVEPLERRMAKLGEEVVYGHRHDFMQAKMYLKERDQGKALPSEEHRVRMEVTLRRWACHEFGVNHVQDLMGFPFRSKFATHFRIVDHPEVRGRNRLSLEEQARRAKRMVRAWSTAGVGKFSVGDRPREEIIAPAVQRVQARSRSQLPISEYKLIRDQKANAKIGAALMNLQRRMAA